MRTTIAIDDDVLLAAKSLARSENRTLGKVVSDLMRRGLRPRPYQREGNDLPVFRVSEDAPLITAETVQSANDTDA